MTTAEWIINHIGYVIAGLAFLMLTLCWALDKMDRKHGLPHKWSEPFTIGGHEYDITPGFIGVTCKRTLRICNNCMITDAMSDLVPFCTPKEFHDDRCQENR